MFWLHQSSAGGFQETVSEYCHLIVLSLFFECFKVSSRSQNKCVLLPTEYFVPAFCFNNELCTCCVREQVITKTTKILVFHKSNDGGGRCWWLDLYKNKSILKNTCTEKKILVSKNNSTHQKPGAFPLCKSSLSHYHWFKVLREKAEYFYIFLMFGPQWTIAQPRDREHSGTKQPAQHSNICIEASVLILSKGLMFVSIQMKHKAAVLFDYSKSYFTWGL